MASTSSAGVGWSTASNAFTAGQAASRLALQRLTTRSPQCVIVFGSSWFDQERLLAGVRSVFDAVPVAGGSTAGEIISEGPMSHSCVVLAVADEQLVASVGVGRELQQNPRLAGYHAAQQALRQFNGKPRSGLVLFGDGLLPGYADVLRGIQEVVGTSSLSTGALMADDLRFSKTYQYANDEVFSQAVVGLLFGGACTLGVGLDHGFAPISKPRQITKAHANVLEELDGQPALSVYEDYFGRSVMEAGPEGLTRRLIAYPLGIALEATGEFLLRNVMAVGPDGGLVCTGEITQGSSVQLMIGSKELALEAASRAAERAIQQIRAVRFVLVFDSVARKLLLGRDAQREISRIRDVIGPSVPLAGCYTYGEQAPLRPPHPYGQASVQTGSILIVAVGL